MASRPRLSPEADRVAEVVASAGRGARSTVRGEKSRDEQGRDCTDHKEKIVLGLGDCKSPTRAPRVTPYE